MQPKVYNLTYAEKLKKRLHIWQTDDVNNPDCGTVLRLEYNVPNSPNGCQQSGSSLWDFKAKLDGNSNGLLTLNNASTSQVVLSFLHNGKVGIGTAAPIQTLDVNGKMNLSGGVIQQGGLPITSTSDLGLYSLNGLHMRFVTNNAPFRFFSDGGTTPEGNKELVSIESSGNLRMNEHDVLFRSGFPDGSHGIGWYGQDNNISPPITKLFAGENVNGPVLYGYDGGALGTKQGTTETIALRWNAAGLDILDGSIHMNGDPNDLWTTSHWQPILKAPLGSVWRTTDRAFNSQYYLGFGMTSTGWYWGAASADDASGGPWYPMSLTDGTPPTGWVLTVDGRVVTKVLDVAPDYVLEKDYKLMPLEELEKYKDKYKHLPDIPSGKEINENGISVGDFSLLLLKKIEELALYLIELKKENKAMAVEIEKLKKGK